MEDNLTSADPLSYTTTIVRVEGDEINKISNFRAEQVRENFPRDVYIFFKRKI